MGHCQSSDWGCACASRDAPQATAANIGELEEQVRQLQAQVQLLRLECRSRTDEGAVKVTRLSDVSTSAGTGLSRSETETADDGARKVTRLSELSTSAISELSDSYDSPFDAQLLQKDLLEDDLCEALDSKKQDVVGRASVRSEWWLNTNPASPRSTRIRHTGRMPRPTLLESEPEKPRKLSNEFFEPEARNAVVVSPGDPAIVAPSRSEEPWTPPKRSVRIGSVDVLEPCEEHMGEGRCRRYRLDLVHNGTVDFCDPEESERLHGQYDAMAAQHRLDVLHRNSVESVDYGRCSSNADDVSLQYSQMTAMSETDSHRGSWESDPNRGSWVQDWQDMSKPRPSCAPAPALADLYALPLDSRVPSQRRGALN